MHTYQGVVDCFFILTWFMFNFSSACIFVLFCNIVDSGFQNNIMNIVNALMLRSEHNIILTNSYIFLCYYFKLYLAHRTKIIMQLVFGDIPNTFKYENIIFNECMAFNTYLFFNLLIYAYGNKKYLLMSVFSLIYMNYPFISFNIDLMTSYVQNNYFVKTFMTAYIFSTQKIKSNTVYINVSNMLYPFIKSFNDMVMDIKLNVIKVFMAHVMKYVSDNKFINMEHQEQILRDIASNNNQRADTGMNDLNNILREDVCALQKMFPEHIKHKDDKSLHENNICDYDDSCSTDSTQTVEDEQLKKEQPRKISISSSDSSKSTVSENDEPYKSSLMSSTLNEINSSESSNTDNSEDNNNIGQNMSLTDSVISKDELNDLNKLFESSEGNNNVEDKLKLFSLIMDTYNKQCENIYDNPLVSEEDKHDMNANVNTLNQLNELLQTVDISSVSEKHYDLTDRKEDIRSKKDN